MGARELTERTWLGGGRWSAASSLWTYFHRLLHMLGILSVDREEFSLLSGHAIRIRHERTGRALATSASLTRAALNTDALSLSKDTSAADGIDKDNAHVDSLFFVHFDRTQHSSQSPSQADDDQSFDVLRLATARPPRAWLSAPQTIAGPLVLAHSRSAGAKFEVISAGNHTVALRVQPAGLCAGSAAHSFLRVESERPRGATDDPVNISAGAIDARARFSLNVVPLGESSILHATPQSHPEIDDTDPTVSSVLSLTRSIPVRLESVRRNSFLAALPGEPMRVARAGDAGWDVFTLVHDIKTATAVLQDSQGTPLEFNETFTGLLAAKKNSSGERFTIAQVARSEGGGDDRVTLRSRKGYLSVSRKADVGLERERKPGRNEAFWLRLALPSMADRSKPRRQLRHLGDGVRVVEATIEVPVDGDIGYEVLTDYEGFSSFVEDAAESGIVERYEENHLAVRMVQSHSFLVLTLNLGMSLDVHEFPDEQKVTMEMTKGFGVREYHGTWSSLPKGDGQCVLKCELRAAPAIPAPAFLIDGVITHALCSTMEQLRVECMKRGAARKAANSRR